MKKMFFYILFMVLFFLGCSDAKIEENTNQATNKEVRDCKHFHNLKDALQAPDEVCSLYLSSRSEFPTKLLDFPNLKKLTLNKCTFKQFPLEFVRKVKLESLIVSNSNVLPLNSSKFAGLKRLILTKNNIPNIEDKICDFRSLNILYLIESINSIPRCFGGLQELKELQIGMSKLSELPPEMKELNQLEELVISSTSLSSVNFIISELENLKVLHLKYNKLPENEIIQIKEQFGYIDLIIKQ